MFPKGSAGYSILHRKCPHCHEGEFLVSRNPYDLSHAGDLLEGCEVCRRKYAPEPGFYYGGMYVSYALAVAQSVAVYIAVGVLFPMTSPTTRLWWVLGALILLTPVIYAWSKVLWANLFIKFKGVEALPDEDPKWAMP
jgi:hypothetical protein